MIRRIATSFLTELNLSLKWSVWNKINRRLNHKRAHDFYPHLRLLLLLPLPLVLLVLPLLLLLIDSNVTREIILSRAKDPSTLFTSLRPPTIILNAVVFRIVTISRPVQIHFSPLRTGRQILDNIPVCASK